MISQKVPECTIDVYDPKTDTASKLNLPKDLAGRFSLLFWYPADFTNVCPTELADLHRRKADLETLGIRVIVASTDTIYTHKGWIGVEELLDGFDFLMAADHNGCLARSLGIYNEASGMAKRTAIFIDPDGIIQAEYGVTNDIGRSAGEVIRIARALKYVRDNPGMACPASWDEGAPTLRKGIQNSGNAGKARQKT